MKITILCVGKIKEVFYKQAVEEFKKRLGRYVRLEIIEVSDEKTPDSASPAEEQQIKNKEGEKLLKSLREDAYVIALTIEGRQRDSENLARHIESLTVSGKSHLVFMIGGSLGLSDSVKKRADEELSFSKMTFPHQLMRVVLLEQIYRSFRIIQNEPYHK